ncbi:hypothetical protein SAMN05216337_1001215 [Bradyrhizobium brasilense]|uniref:Uncharacterized protein n=1 Tax=Bradyrhizobium brasilense TaxID=1419277 RepID=A0A1G6IPT1_9BRAD|nr:hypothetical protein [Bradyrhizobium brasilense]SDC08450.1 hypothetical protein SAMN05216337_1001215 [Bradyrhizobium brasilense]
MSKSDRIARLRAQYAALHREVLELSTRRGFAGGIAEWRLQKREQEIVDELRELGVGPYAQDGEAFLRQARAH